MYVQTGATANHKIWIDQKTIPDGCSLVLYNGPPKGDDAHQGACQTYYATISNEGGGCIVTNVDPDYGYAMCCGGDCEAAPAPPGKKRDLLPASKAASSKKERDVTAIKRSNPFNRRDCSFSGTGGSITPFGTQLRLGPPVNCAAGDDPCEVGVGRYQNFYIIRPKAFRDSPLT